MTDLQILLAIFDASAFFQWFMEHASYWFVFIFMVVESSFIPFPSELVVPPAAYLACAPGSGSSMSLFGVVAMATAGALVGALVNYGLALWLGRPIVNSFANSRFGHACLINQEKVDRAERYFDEHGAISTFIGRLVPVVRQLISIPAGLSKMNIGKFCLFTALGAAVWNMVMAALGYFLAKTVPLSGLLSTIEEYNSYLSYAGLALGAACVAYILYNAFKSNKSTNSPKQ